MDIFISSNISIKWRNENRELPLKKTINRHLIAQKSGGSGKNFHWNSNVVKRKAICLRQTFYEMLVFEWFFAAKYILHDAFVWIFSRFDQSYWFAHYAPLMHYFNVRISDRNDTSMRKRSDSWLRWIFPRYIYWNNHISFRIFLKIVYR